MKTLFYLLLFMFPAAGFCQDQGNFWYFGDGAGLDFNSGSPVVLTDGQTAFAGCPACHAEGTATISDANGNLLFYTDGNQVWDRAHNLMPNGDSLMSNISSTQSSLIVPQPGSSRFYYIFTTDDFHLNNLAGGLRFSIVDLCLEGGMGDVIAESKNVLLVEDVAEKLTGVKHANGEDYWVITHKFNSNQFAAFLLSSNGIVDTVYSAVGSDHTGSPGASIGQLKASPNGLRLAAVNSQSNPCIAEYFDFDPSTGIVSNSVSVQTNPAWGYYGVSFSPDSEKLYIASTINGNGLFQFDLTAGGGTPAAVVASMTQIATGYNFLGLQLGPDGKIYVARSPMGFNDKLGVIHNPNQLGVACNYLNSGVNLQGRSASYGFPNFIDSYDYDNGVWDCATSISEIDNNASGARELVRICDILGREATDRPHELLFFIYSDGTVERIYRTE